MSTAILTQCMHPISAFYYTKAITRPQCILWYVFVPNYSRSVDITGTHHIKGTTNTTHATRVSVPDKKVHRVRMHITFQQSWRSGVFNNNCIQMQTRNRCSRINVNSLIRSCGRLSGSKLFPDNVSISLHDHVYKK